MQFARGTMSWIFKISILLFAVITPLVIALGSAQTVRTALRQSHIYDHLVDGVFNSLQKKPQAETTSDAQTPASQTAIKNAIDRAFPPIFLEKSANQIVDSTYRWLDGKTQQPDFSVDLTSSKQLLATYIAEDAVNRAKTLPPCTEPTLLAVQTPDDPYFWTCMPPRLDMEVVRQQIFQLVITNQDFLPETVITAKTFQGQDQKSQGFFQNSRVPKTFQNAKRLPWILGVASLASMLALLFLHQDKRRGVFVVSRSFLITGVVLLIGTGFSIFITNNLNINSDASISSLIQESLSLLIRHLINSINRNILIFAVAYVVIGGIGMAILHFTGRKNSSRQASGAPAPKTSASKK